jgi:hypothetical protein
MRLLFFGGIILLCVALIFKGSYDAAQRRDDYNKYGGDYLIKAISEYNSKTMSGPIGSAGVVRAPLTNYGPGTKQPGTGQQGKKPVSSQPIYRQGGGMVTRPVSPAQPYYPTQDPPQSMGNKQGSRPSDSYYPPPPVEERSPSQGVPLAPSSSKSTLKPYLAKDIPQQTWPDKLVTLRSGQKIGFNGADVYTFDPEGKPVVMPDGYYHLGSSRIHVQNGKKVIYEE